MAKKKFKDSAPTDWANLSQNKDEIKNIPAGSLNGAGQGAGKGSK